MSKTFEAIHSPMCPARAGPADDRADPRVQSDALRQQVGEIGQIVECGCVHGHDRATFRRPQMRASAAAIVTGCLP